MHTINVGKELKMTTETGSLQDNTKLESSENSGTQDEILDLKKFIKTLQNNAEKNEILIDLLTTKLAAKTISLTSFTKFIQFFLADVSAHDRGVYSQRLDEICDADWKQFEKDYKEHDLIGKV